MNGGFVDVWQGRLDLPEAVTIRLAEVLSADERARAAAFKFAHLRDRYVVGRGLLRQTLASYTGSDPAGLRFRVGEFGKPALSGGPGFNVSHTADALLIAVADAADIGIDIEAVKPARDLSGLAERCFSVDEYAVWLSLAESERVAAFYRLWTKKEAFVKAVGRGIALGVELCEFDVTAGGGLRKVPDEYGPVEAWRVEELDAGADFSAALVGPARAYRLRRLLLADGYGGGI
ncbi:hypothetical protein BJL95_17420 [Methylomonas sp. LWB]|uniref:4'-phosphopantetheinyl transferase family protein n=1 Tax=Methylomonas sp. LWB TaxID=1905845 RepID=UPI0008D9685E|nr:4'-phosphopantetheinyl transferase superfamily protein [Methylomonas sp. LWB]OHX34443.1 hypothetical protein BJL95_17420 [Methylomonas sp. LWB]